MIKAILFDLDGTLLDTLSDLQNAVNYALVSHGYPPKGRDEVRRAVGNGVKNLIWRVTPPDCTDAQRERVLAVFKEYYALHSMDETVPYDGVISLLTDVKARGIMTAVLSNKFDKAVKELCREVFGNLIDLPIGEGNGIPMKPSPEGCYAVLKHFSLPKRDAVYVGDSDVDVQTAKNAGLICVGVTWGFRSRDVLESAGADYIIDSPLRLMALPIFRQTR